MRRYVIAALAVAAALALNLLLVPWIQANTFPLFLVAVMAVAWYGGPGPGLAAIAVATLANAYFFVTPGQVLGIANASAGATCPVGRYRRSSDIDPAGGGRTLSLERRLRFEPGRVVLVTSENDALVVR
jgi:hypothetical protein